MWQVAGRPFGIWLAVLLLVLNGIASLVQASVLFMSSSDAGDVADAVISIILGLLLFSRAYGIWSLRRLAWLVTVILLVLRIAFVIPRLFIGPPTIYDWAVLVLGILALVLLLLPRVRTLFTQAGSGA